MTHSLIRTLAHACCPAWICVSAAVFPGDACGQDAASATVATYRAPVRDEPLIRGEVLDAETGEPVERFRILPGVPFGRAADGEDPACASWQPHLIRECEGGAFEWPRERAYPVLQLRIEAEGYVPVTSDWITKDEATWIVVAKLARDRGIAGRVLTPDGKPAVGATLAVGLANRTIRLDGKTVAGADEPLPERLSDAWRRPPIIQADDDGRFTLPTETDPAAMLCVTHESGYLERPFSQLVALRGKERDELPLEISAWGHIAGEVVWKDHPGANEPIHLSIMRENVYPELISSFRQTETGADGRFEFDEVPPGHVQLSRRVKVGEISYAFPYAHVQIQPGALTPVVIGGRGVTVVGTLAGLDSYTGVTVRMQPRAPHIGFPGDNQIWQGYNAVRESDIGPLYFRDAVPVSDDGTFRIDHVLPGDYQAFIANEDRSVYRVHSAQLPTETDASIADDIFDLGRIEVARTAAAKSEPKESSALDATESLRAARDP